MTINNPIVAAGPTVTREDAATIVLRITKTPLSKFRVYEEDGLVVVENQNPVREGEMIVYINEVRVARMYVAVLISSSLEWKVVQNWGTIIDPRTGLAKDPLLGFYSGLAPYPS